VSDEERKERIDEPAAEGVDETAEESLGGAGEAGEGGESPRAAAEDAEGEAEQKPKPKPRARRKKAQPKAEEPDDAEEAKQEAAVEEAEAEAGELGGAGEAGEGGESPRGEPPAEDEDAKPKGRRRRGAAEVTAGKRAAPRRRSPDEVVTVRAKAKYVRTAPRKARLVIDHIRGKPVDKARALLLTTPRAASRDVLKLLDSAIANAENNHELVADELVVGRAYVDEGPTLKRYRPRALGRATRIRKRTSHMTIELTNQTGR